MQKISGDLGSDIVCGRVGSFSKNEWENGHKIAALREFLFNPGAVVTDDLREIFREAHPIEYKEQITAVRAQIAEFAKAMMEMINKGVDLGFLLEGTLGPSGTIYGLLKELRYLGDVESTERFYKEAELPVDGFLETAQAEYALGFTGAIPMMVNMVAYRKFAGTPCLNYNAAGSLAFLKKCSDLGVEAAADRLVFAYRYNRLGQGNERLLLNLTSEAREAGIKSLAEKGNYYALEALGFVANAGNLEPGVWEVAPAERVKLFAKALYKEQDGRPIQWIDRALETNRIGTLSLEASLDDRLIELHTRASLQNTRALGILQRAYSQGSLGEEVIDMAPLAREEAARSLTLCDEDLLCDELYKDKDFEELHIRAKEESRPAQKYLAHLYQYKVEGSGLIQEGLVDREKQNKLLMDLANDGCEEARLFLLQELTPLGGASKSISTETLLSWALTGSEKSARLYIDRCEESVKPNVRILFALLFSVK